jgi:hypothetical protein
MISVIHNEMDPIEAVQTQLRSMERNYKKTAGQNFFSMNIDPIVVDNFKSYAGVSADYTVAIDTDIAYGRIQGFNVNGKSITISKLVGSKDSLNTYFNDIEESLRISDKYEPKDIKNFTQTTTHVPTDTYYKYKEVSFDCPKDWKITEGVIVENYIYQINCSTPDDDTLVITVAKLKIDPTKSLKNALVSTADEARGVIGNDDCINIKPIKPDNFKNYSGVSAYYNITSGSNILFGKAYSFNVGDRTVLINKLVNSKDSLNSYCDIIENSLIISNKQ